MNNKNTLITLIVILVGLITFLGGYLIAKKDNFSANIGNLNRFSASESGKGDGRSTRNGSSASWRTALGRLTSVKAVNPSISEDGKKILYTEKGTGKIFAVDFSGQENNFLETEAKSTLNGNISGMVLSKDKQKMAYLYFDKNTGEGQISIANPDGSVFKNILPTRAGQLKIAWVNNNLISFYNPKGEDRSLFLLNLENSRLEKILDSLENLKLLWSPDGTKLLYSSGIQLALLDLGTKSTLTIDLPTEADRCAWTMNSLLIFCGAMQNGSDNLYQLDINKREFGLVFEPSSVDHLKIKNPFLSPAEDSLFFVNDLDGYLYRINLN